MTNVTTRRRKHIWLYHGPFLPVISCGRCRRRVVLCWAMRSVARYIVVQDCALEVGAANIAKPAPDTRRPTGGRRMHIDRSREYRARGRGVTDQGLIPSRQPETGRAAAVAGATARHDLRPAHDCLLPLRQSRLRQSAPIANTSARAARPEGSN